MNRRAVVRELVAAAEDLMAAESGTFKCPDCGAKVLKNTGYCVKCKKKVKSAAGPKTIDDLPTAEQAIARKMMAKGYRYCIQIVTKDGDFGEPLYFKSSDQVGPFLRSFPDYQNAKTKWIVKLPEE